MNVLIIDVAVKSRQILRRKLKQYCPEVGVVRETENIINAVEMIHTRAPDIVFLDIEIENGFQFFDYISNYSFKVIFITACKTHALRAFDYAVVDYILKPINISRLVRAVKYVYDNYFLKQLARSSQPNNHQAQRLAIPTINGFKIINLSEILYCQAERNYTKIYLDNGKKMMISKNLGKLEYLLNTSSFLRIHRSFIVNFNKIQQFQKGKTPVIILSDCTALEVSTHKKEALLQRLQFI